MPHDILAPPFVIGQKMWKPVTCQHQVTLPCPVCYGKLAVVVELGNGERVGVPCSGCGLGYEGPRGVIQEWDATPGASEVTIVGIASFSGGRFYVHLQGEDPRCSTDVDDLYATEELALTASVVAIERLHDENMNRKRRSKDRSTLAKHAWEVRYHRGEIKSHERQLLHHRAKLTDMGIAN